MNALALPTGCAARGPDLAQAGAYLAVLTGETDPIVTFQTFSDRKVKGAKRDTLARVLHGTLRQRGAELARLNEVGAGVFVMVNAGDLKGRREKNVTSVRAIFIDEDAPRLRPYALRPSFMVRTSAERAHAYWLPRGVVPLSGFKPAQKRLIDYYGSDPDINDLPRVLRLPGFYHRKGEPRLVIFEPCSGLRYALGQILAAHPAIFKPRPTLVLVPRQRSTSSDEDTIVRDDVLDKADARSWAENERHHSARAIAVYARKLGMSEGEILRIVSDRLVAAGKSAEEAREIVTWTMTNVVPILGDRERVVRRALTGRAS